MSVNIAGTGLTKISEHWSKSIIDLAVMSGRQALSESDISPDMIIIGNMLSSYASNQENLGSIISEKFSPLAMAIAELKNGILLTAFKLPSNGSINAIGSLDFP